MAFNPAPSVSALFRVERQGEGLMPGHSRSGRRNSGDRAVTTPKHLTNVIASRPRGLSLFNAKDIARTPIVPSFPSAPLLHFSLLSMSSPILGRQAIVTQSLPTMAFTPIEAVLGGIAIGLVTFWNARLNGTVTGISGELSKAIAGRTASRAFVAGLISAGIMLKHFIPTPFEANIIRHVPLHLALLAGFLVGFGTKLGNGCTSGHGVCGLSRFSMRSLVATVTFMATAMLTATLFSSLDCYSGSSMHAQLSLSAMSFPPAAEFPWMLAVIAAAFSLPPIMGVVCQALRKNTDYTSFLKQAIQYVLGLCFGGGLIVSGMAMPTKTVGFLDLRSGAWDPSLIFVFVGALPIAIAGFRPIVHGGTPVLADFSSLPTRKDIDAKLVAGAVLFGVGWGLVGLCPGPALVYLGAFPYTRNILVFCACLAAGSLACTRVTDAIQKWKL